MHQETIEWASTNKPITKEFAATVIVECYSVTAIAAISLREHFLGISILLLLLLKSLHFPFCFVTNRDFRQFYQTMF